MPKVPPVKQPSKTSAKKSAAKKTPQKLSGRFESKAAKKVAKKAAKKVAKKAAKKTPAKHAEGHHLRRAYEHLHRVGAMHQQLDREALTHIDTLSELAQSALMAENAQSAADLLRAAEHLAFGSLALESEDVYAGEDLLETAEREYESLIGRADDRWDGEDLFAELEPVYEAMRRAAEVAFEAHALHRALEYARGAEALTHVEPQQRRESVQPSKKKTKRLRG